MANKTVLMIAPQTDTFVNFRGDLICDIRKKGYDCEARYATED